MRGGMFRWLCSGQRGRCALGFAAAEDEVEEAAILRLSEERPEALSSSAPTSEASEQRHPVEAAPGRSSCRSAGNQGLTQLMLDDTDLLISQELQLALGLHKPSDKPETPAKALAAGYVDGMPHPMSPSAALFGLIRLIGKTRKLLEWRLLTKAPSVDEIHRGVHIQRVYDFYTVSEKRVRKRKMSAHVFHSRHGEDSDDDASWECSSTHSTSSGSKMSPRTDGARSLHQPHKSLESGPRMNAKAKSYKPEVLARWGVLTGKVMHTKLIDFTRAADKAVRKKRCQAKNGLGTMFHAVRARARVVLNQAWELANRISREPEDCFDVDWQEPDLLVYLFSKEYIDTLAFFGTTARKILSVQPSLVEATVPCRVFGDIHGQLRDLLLLFWAFGLPDECDAPMFVFNGDFVDRGRHQLEVVGLLLAMKVLLPEKVWLVRGNHEDRGMNQKYGFAEECDEKLGPEFGPKIFQIIHSAFDQMPLACVVADRILILHGGIGNGAWRMNDVRNIPRPLGEQQLADPDNTWIYNILWSDPIEDDAGEHSEVFGVHMSPRGERSALFGWDVTKTFCAKEGLSLIVRSHQSKQDSLGFDIMHENLLIRVFSARDYEHHGNDGAVLLITRGNDEHRLLTVTPQILRSTTKALQQKWKDKDVAPTKSQVPASPGRQKPSVQARHQQSGKASNK